MGFFDFFQKEKKETLDKGLAKTKEGMFSKLARAVAGKSTVDDDILDNLEEILITSDVGVETTLRIIERIEQRGRGTKTENRTIRNHACHISHSLVMSRAPLWGADFFCRSCLFPRPGKLFMPTQIF